MINYVMKDLIPVVTNLVDRYTSKESTSVRMEVAKQLLGAVIYCIQQNEEDFQVASRQKFEAEAVKLNWNLIEKNESLLKGKEGNAETFYYFEKR